MSAKEAMVNAIRFLEDDPIDTIELMTMDMLMAGQDDTGWKEQVAALDLVIPEEAEILEAAGVQERNLLKEAGERTFLRMFMKYLQKNQGRIFLLAGSEEELKRLESVSDDNEELLIVVEMVATIMKGMVNEYDG